MINSDYNEILIRPYVKNAVHKEEIKYWQHIGQKSLYEIWDNEHDEVYSELLYR